MNEAPAIPRPSSRRRAAPAGHTDLADLTAVLRASLVDYLSGRTCTPHADAARDAALAELRVRGQDRVLRDLDDNLADIEALYGQVRAELELHDVDLPIERDLIQRLHLLRATIAATDPYGAGDVEEQCWMHVQQFYYDAIDAAQRLIDRRAGRIPTPGQYDEDGHVRRYDIRGISARSRWQAGLNVAEVAVPNPFEARVLPTFAPTLAHMLWHQFVPWGTLWWHDFERTTLGWLKKNHLARLRYDSSRQAVVRTIGREHLHGNTEIFDAVARRVRHNVILAASHRLGFMDFPFFAEVLRDVPHIVWANNSFYTPGMARKLARSRSAIPVRGHGRLAFRDAIDLTIRVFAEDGLPLFIMADGATKNMLYGQYLRVKRGIRVLVDECVRRRGDGDRGTFILPITFDDPFAYLLDFEDEIRVNIHPPIEITMPTSPQAHTSVFDESAHNGGDALLNHLEALYFVNSVQARVGLIAPRVVPGVERWYALSRGGRRGGGLRGWLRRRANMSVYDLARMSAAIWREEAGYKAP